MVHRRKKGEWNQRQNNSGTIGATLRRTGTGASARSEQRQAALAIDAQWTRKKNYKIIETIIQNKNVGLACVFTELCVLVCFGTCHFAVIVPPLPLFYSLLNSVPFIFSGARLPPSIRNFCTCCHLLFPFFSLYDSVSCLRFCSVVCVQTRYAWAIFFATFSVYFFSPSLSLHFSPLLRRETGGKK